MACKNSKSSTMSSLKGQTRGIPHADVPELPLEKLIQDNLISTGSLSSVAVLTSTGTCVYSYGQLVEQDKQCWKQFTDTSGQALDAVPKVSLILDDKKVPFVVFRKTLSSIYATSAGNKYGLIVCSYPLGVLVCISEPPTPFSKAVTAVENVCSLLRT